MTKQRQRERAKRRQAELREARERRRYEAEMMVRRCEKVFLIDALRPFHATIAEALIPHYQLVFDADDQTDDDPEEAIGYAADLIWDVDDVEDPLAAAINDIYRDGAEAVLPHFERALAWRMAFDARRMRPDQTDQEAPLH
jgi:hypothetical protein